MKVFFFLNRWLMRTFRIFFNYQNLFNRISCLKVTVVKVNVFDFCAKHTAPINKPWITSCFVMSTGCEEGGKPTFWLSRNRLRMSRNAIETVSTVHMSMAGLSEIIIIIIIIICSFCNARHINPLGSQGAAVWQPHRTHR